MVNVSNVMMGLVFTFLAVVIIIFTLSLGGSLQSELQEQNCENIGGTYQYYAENATLGCCTTAANSSSCTTFTYTTAYNATNEGLDAIDTASGFMGTIVLAVIIGAVIAVLMVAIGGALSAGRGRGY